MLNQSSDLKQMPDEYWQKKLTPEQYRVLRQADTERPFTGKFVDHKEKGMYTCAACGQELFSSDAKFESHSGWPSFHDVIEQGTVELRDDFSHGMSRVEVLCGNCGGHLGHVFMYGPNDQTDKYFCINSCALGFEEK
jgi:peptide-methionine (R)-S-oxide reductase